MPEPAEAGFFKKIKKGINKVANQIGVDSCYNDIGRNEVVVDREKSWKESTYKRPRIVYTHTAKFIPCEKLRKQTRRVNFGKCASTHKDYLGGWRHCARAAAPNLYGNTKGNYTFVYNNPDYPGDIRNGVEIERARLCLYEDGWLGNRFDIGDPLEGSMPFHKNTPRDTIYTDILSTLLGLYVYGVVAGEYIRLELAKLIWGSTGLESGFMDESFGFFDMMISTVTGDWLSTMQGWIQGADDINLITGCSTKSCRGSSAGRAEGIVDKSCIDFKLPWGPPPFHNQYIPSGIYPEVTPICTDYTHSNDLVDSVECVSPITEASSFFAPRFEVRFNNYIVNCSDAAAGGCINFKNFNGDTPQRVGVCSGSGLDPCFEPVNLTVASGGSYNNIDLSEQYRVSYSLYYSDGIKVVNDTSRIATHSVEYRPTMIDIGDYAEIVGTPDSSQAKNIYNFNQVTLQHQHVGGATYNLTISAGFEEEDSTQICFYSSGAGAEEAEILGCYDRPKLTKIRVEEAAGNSSENPAMNLIIGEGANEASTTFTLEDITEGGKMLHGITFTPTLLYPRGYYLDSEGEVQCKTSNNSTCLEGEIMCKINNCSEITFDNPNECRSIPGLKTALSEVENEDGTYDLEYNKGAAYMCINEYEGDGSTYIVKKMKLMEYYDNDDVFHKVEIGSLWPSIDEWSNDIYYPSSVYDTNTDDVIGLLDGINVPGEDETLAMKSPFAYATAAQPYGLCIPVTTQYEDLLKIDALSKTESEIRNMSLNSLKVYRDEDYPDGNEDLDYYIRCREYFYHKDGYDVTDSPSGPEVGDCSGDHYALDSAVQSVLIWSAASIGENSQLLLSPSIKNQVCGLMKSSHWESNDNSTTVLTRTCQADGTLSTEIKINDEVITEANKLVSCVPKQKSISFSKASTAFAYTEANNPSAKGLNYHSINDRTGVSNGGKVSGYDVVNLGMVHGSNYSFHDKRCYAFYVPYKFTINGNPSDVLEGFSLRDVVGAADVLSIVANSSLVRTYKGGDITSTGRVFFGYGQSDSKVDYCATASGIGNVLECYESGALRIDATNCNDNNYSVSTNVSMLDYLKSGSNSLYLIYAIRKEGNGYISLRYKFKTDSVRFLE